MQEEATEPFLHGVPSVVGVTRGTQRITPHHGVDHRTYGVGCGVITRCCLLDVAKHRTERRISRNGSPIAKKPTLHFAIQGMYDAVSAVESCCPGFFTSLESKASNSLPSCYSPGVRVDRLVLEIATVDAWFFFPSSETKFLHGFIHPHQYCINGNVVLPQPSQGTRPIDVFSADMLRGIGRSSTGWVSLPFCLGLFIHLWFACPVPPVLRAGQQTDCPRSYCWGLPAAVLADRFAVFL